MRHEGKEDLFERLKPYLQLDVEGDPYNTIASDMQVSKNAVLVAVYRLRQRYRSLVRKRVQQILPEGESIDDELTHLFHVLNQ